MGRRVAFFAVISAGALGVVGFLLFNGINKKNYLTDNLLPSWTTQGVNRTSNQLFESFKITATHQAPQIGETFPLTSLKNVDGTSVSLRGKTSVLLVGGDNCTSCAKIVDSLPNRTQVRLVRIIPYGQLPNATQDIAVVDARLEEDKNNTEVVPKSGKLKDWIGMAQFVGSYVLDAEGKVYYAAFQSTPAGDIAAALERIKAGQSPAPSTIKPAVLGQKLPLPGLENQKEGLRNVLNAKTGVVIFTADGCSSCEGLSNDLKAAAQKWMDLGASVAIVDAGRKQDGELMPGVPVIADPDGILSNAWGRTSIPQATILDGGKYAGTTPFAESQFRRQLPGQPEESFATKAPFIRAIGDSVAYVQEKRGDKNP
jgi:hypothetical protein